ncbi:hypothetical protein [Halolamina salina]|uniref:Uncharacterized protein n=1 Tax=Halolamina salina TaxID=1220023 RepID=A0ABD6B5I2_9EURY
MTGPPEDPPEARRLDDFYEIAVDGRTVLRVEEISEFKQSAVDDAVIAHVLSGVGEAIAEDIEEEHGKTPEEVIEAAEPEVAEFDPDVGEWE